MKMKKAVLMWLMLVLLVNGLFAVASSSDSSSGDSSSSSCNWWCKKADGFLHRMDNDPFLCPEKFVVGEVI